MSNDCFLFVYGTLLPWTTGSLGAAERARLSSECKLIGAASMSGLLLDLGGYPGLVDGGELVFGAVYELTGDAERTFAWLDAYEELSGHDGDEYRRIIKSVGLSCGRTLQAYVYVCTAAGGVRPLIASGVWSPSGNT